MNARVLVLRDGNGAAIRQMDLSDLDNTNAAAPMTLTVETQCDLGEWHQTDRLSPAPWGAAIVSETNHS